jgi:hypothetical protein
MKDEKIKSFECNFVNYGDVEKRCTKCGYIIEKVHAKNEKDILCDMINNNYPPPDCEITYQSPLFKAIMKNLCKNLPGTNVLTS